MLFQVLTRIKNARINYKLVNLWHHSKGFAFFKFLIFFRWLKEKENENVAIWSAEHREKCVLQYTDEDFINKFWWQKDHMRQSTNIWLTFHFLCGKQNKLSHNIYLWWQLYLYHKTWQFFEAVTNLKCNKLEKTREFCKLCPTHTS